MVKPLFFCDFDGVLNTFPYERNWVGPNRDRMDMYDPAFNDPKNWKTSNLKANPETHYKLDQIKKASTHGKTYTITFSSELVNQIRKLIVNDKINFVWLTSWREDAQTELNSLLSFPQAKTVSLNWYRRHSDYNGGMGKWEALCAYLKDNKVPYNTPIVWVDDEAAKPYITHPIDKNKEDYDRLIGKHQVPDSNYKKWCVICPNITWGISQNEFKAIKGFIEDSH